MTRQIATARVFSGTREALAGAGPQRMRFHASEIAGACAPIDGADGGQTLRNPRARSLFQLRRFSAAGADAQGVSIDSDQMVTDFRRALHNEWGLSLWLNRKTAATPATPDAGLRPTRRKEKSDCSKTWKWSARSTPKLDAAVVKITASTIISAAH